MKPCAIVAWSALLVGCQGSSELVTTNDAGQASDSAIARSPADTGPAASAAGAATKDASAATRPAAKLQGWRIEQVVENGWVTRRATEARNPDGAHRSGAPGVPRITAPTASDAVPEMTAAAESPATPRARSLDPILDPDGADDEAAAGSSGVMGGATGDLPGRTLGMGDMGDSVRPASTAVLPKAQRPGQPAAADAAPLRAGDTDDNACYPQFLQFMDSARDRWDQSSVRYLDVSSRRFVLVTDRNQRPLPNARVEILDPQGQAIFDATSYGDGKVAFFPRVYDPRTTLTWYRVRVTYQDHVVTRDWGNDAVRPTLTVAVPVAAQRPPLKLDVAFVIDTTGSMDDEIARIKSTLLTVTAQLRKTSAEVDLRYGAVLYRDLGDEYLTRTYPLTKNIAAFDQALQQVAATGGGDEAESVNQALQQAIHGLEWRDDAARVAFLIADAPPHLDYDDDVPYTESLKDAAAIGLRIHSVAASGLNPIGSIVFRQIAQFTRGKFIFIEYGSIEASAARHGVAAAVESNNLDQIIYRQLMWEMLHFGRAATETVDERQCNALADVGPRCDPGSYVNGDCSRPMGQGILSKAHILMTIKKNMPGVKACTAEQARRDRRLASGELKMQWYVQADGRTTNIAIMTSKFKGTYVGICVQDVIRKMRFPAFDGADVGPIKFPFNLD